MTHRRIRSQLLLLAGALALFAAPVAPTVAQTKIGFVNVAKVLEQAPQAEDARNRIEKEFMPRDRELLAQQKQVRALEDKLVKNAAVMSASERQRQENDIRQLKRDVRRSQEEFREDLNLRRSEELSKLQRQVAEVIQTMGKADKYDLVVTDGVIYAGEKIDITDKVIERLKSEFKRTGG